ncbi:hypothetical protein GCK32_006946 [Trichostrongylus colubriformis]|uniref:Uncharacterized protein n=1 Tax=Trichostrongylus colubriformis TaxID=6319 RepID=A0AAN8IM70_TRICO
MDTVVEFEQQRVCRVMSGKKGRFTIENLNYVRCALISDNENLSLLEKATTSVHYDDVSRKVMARLTLSIQETQRKNSEANYVMDVVETYVDDCDGISCVDCFTSPHVIIFAVSTDDKSLASMRLELLRKKIESEDWVCPVILLAYRFPNSGQTSYDVMKQLKELSRNARVYRCMESTGLGRNLLRHCFAVALMAARPFLATIRAENDVRIDDGIEKRREKPSPLRKPNLEDKIPTIETLQNKSPFRNSCRIQ